MRLEEPVFLHAIPDLIAMQAEQGGCARLIASCPLESQLDESLFDLVEVEALGRKLNWIHVGWRPGRRGGTAGAPSDSKSPGSSTAFSASSTARSTMFRSSRTLPGQDVREQRLLGCGTQRPNRLLEFPAEDVHVVLGEQDDVAPRSRSGGIAMRSTFRR